MRSQTCQGSAEGAEGPRHSSVMSCTVCYSASVAIQLCSEGEWRRGLFTALSSTCSTQHSSPVSFAAERYLSAVVSGAFPPRGD